MNVDEIRQQYEQSLEDYRYAVEKRSPNWREMKNIESEIIVNGGYGEIVIDGKNAEQREAQLRLARNLHPEWPRLDRNVRDADAKREMAIADMEMCKAFLAYETALANERASTGVK